MTKGRCVRSVLVAMGAGLLLAAGATAQAGGSSIGNTHSGRLVGGAAIPEQGEGFRFETARGNPDARYGTPSLIRALLAAIDRVNQAAPGGMLVVEDLSNPGGGPIQGHGSHASGRDVDLRYYAVGPDGQPLAPERLSYGPTGLAADRPAQRFDTRRNWLMVEALLTSHEARVRYIFAAPWIERLLVDYGRQHADRAVVRQAAVKLRPPGTRGAAPHDDHMHLRIECPPADVRLGCRR